MNAPWDLYERLPGHVTDKARIEQVVIGLTWTLCRSSGPKGRGSGLAMSPGTPIRTLPWSGTLAGRPASELVQWLFSWDPYEATVAMAAVNSVINTGSALAASAIPLFHQGPDNLAVFEHFADRIKGRKVVVVGRYPGLDGLGLDCDMRVLERQPGPGDLPDPAAEYLLPEADWVFLTATSIPNKTFPRLAELSRDAELVLMGPTVPWLEALAEFGVDYLAGVQVEDSGGLLRTVAEGGGIRIFGNGVRYRVLDLRMTEQERLRQAIAATFARREILKRRMDQWYTAGSRGRFPGWSSLESIDRVLSDLDSRFKRVCEGV